MIQNIRKQSAHVVEFASVAGDNVAQLEFFPIRCIVAYSHWGQLPYVSWEIAEESSNLGESMGFVVRDVIDYTVCGMHFRTTQFFLSHPFSECSFNHCWASN